MAEVPEREFVRANYGSRKGTSGSPVFSINNLVVGVHVKRTFGCTYAVSVPTIKAALRGWLQIADVSVIINVLIVDYFVHSHVQYYISLIFMTLICIFLYI